MIITVILTLDYNDKIGCHNKETNKKILENVIVMENIFYEVS